jgi:hypothetical protein
MQEYNESRENGENGESRDIRDNADIRDSRDSRDNADIRDSRDSRDNADIRVNADNAEYTEYEYNKYSAQYCYLAVKSPALEELQFKNAVTVAVRKCFGLLAAPIDLLHFANGLGYLRVYHDCAPRIITALSLKSEYAGIAWKFEIVAASPHLSSIVQ